MLTLQQAVLLSHAYLVERDATIENVKKKINSLRAGFRKEHKKVQDRKKTGSGTDQVYVPKLWYYSQLEFL
ncbi:hypothetical protein HF086_011397 [Spodoptera exigua]|uniref:MADF domain-containing protein n=1 Tax=Spodoptera exigua TaxID=7107 RepID=A0A922SQV4_SPOEX|nr:hypothetical protein HF086_011397 [Spodoptera exigua]